MPRWRRPSIRGERWGGDARLSCAERPREEPLKYIAAHEQIDCAIRLIFWVTHHRLLYQLNAVAHCAEGGLCGHHRLGCLPAIRNLPMCVYQWFENLKDALLKAIPLRKEELAQIVWARRLRISAGVSCESLRFAVHLKPVKQWIATEPVARLRRGDPEPPGGTIALCRVLFNAAIVVRDGGESGDGWCLAPIAAQILHQRAASPREISATPPRSSTAPAKRAGSAASPRSPTPRSAATSGWRKSAAAATRGAAAA